MTDLRVVVAHLRALGQRGASVERRSEIEAALAHKFEGVQSVAAQVLGQWGGRESIPALRQWLHDCLGRRFGWSIRDVAVGVLADLVGPEDVDWVLDLYFEAEGVLLKRELLFIVMVLPPEAARERLVSMTRHDARETRQAAVKAVGNMAFPDRVELLRPLMDDPHRAVRESARLLSEFEPIRPYPGRHRYIPRG